MDLSLIPTLLLDFDASSAFSGIWSILTQVWQTVMSLLNQIKIGGVSLLFINIALTIFGLIFTVFFAVVKSGVSSSMSAAGRREKRRDVTRSDKQLYDDSIDDLLKNN